MMRFKGWNGKSEGCRNRGFSPISARRALLAPQREALAEILTGVEQLLKQDWTIKSDAELDRKAREGAAHNAKRREFLEARSAALRLRPVAKRREALDELFAKYYSDKRSKREAKQAKKLER